MGMQELNNHEDSGAGSRRERSPNYPALTFTEALERAEKIYKKEKRNPVSQEIAGQHIGYQKLNGATYQAFGALRRYGLLMAGKGDLRISDDAHFIFVHPPDHPDRLAKMRELAMAPALFHKILGAFPDGLPSDENLIAKLQTDEWGFKSKDAARAAVRSLRDAVRIRDGLEDFVTTDETDTAVPAAVPMFHSPGDKAPAIPPMVPRPPLANLARHASASEVGLTRRWEVSPGRFAVVELPPDPTVDEMEALDEFLSLLKQEIVLVWKRKLRNTNNHSSSEGPTP